MSVWDFLLIFGVGFVIGGAMGVLFGVIELMKSREETQQEENPPEPFNE